MPSSPDTIQRFEAHGFSTFHSVLELEADVWAARLQVLIAFLAVTGASSRPAVADDNSLVVFKQSCGWTEA